PAPLYRIARETAEVALVTWLRPDFAMQQIAPVLSGDTVCVLFTGRAGSAHAGESMLILLDSGREEARILVPPTALGEARVMLATPERLLLGLADGVVASALQAGSPWTMVTDRAVRLLEQSPGRDDLLLVASASGGDELLLASAQNLTATRRLASAPHIARICPLPGDRVACLLEEGRAKSLAVYALDRPDSPPVILRQGDCTLGSHPFDDRGERALVNGPGNEIELLDVEAATPTALGSGSSASWVPGQSALVALAADHAGQLQVWRIEPGQTGTRRQLTFLDGGIGGELVVTADGGFALAALPGNGCLAVVQL
ncbi:MAG: hypothetical protein HYV26_24320, partial [Candidatus Hydrogenedentes bacterium]|nr:hypothetical protein [Candidatus Hydrogenedentota bacterium]